ncbi:MAG: hypothetical protein ILP11_02490 [Alphaproteobacteria bacterium]|nr:hypothetical protein [Alphaproteobacteria bacterium]
MLKQVAFGLLALCSFGAQAYEGVSQATSYRPVFVREGIDRPVKPEQEKPEQTYQNLLEQVVDLHNAAYNFTMFMGRLSSYKTAKISAEINNRRMDDFTKCNVNLLGRYFTDPKQVWKKLVDEMKRRMPRETAQLLQEAANGNLTDDDFAALSGIPALELAKMSNEEKEQYATNKYISKLASPTTSKRAAIRQNIGTWEIGREILLDLYSTPEKWGNPKAKFPLWTDANFLLLHQPELIKKKRWNPAWTVELSKPLPFQQEIVLVLPDDAAGFTFYPKAPFPWKVYQELQYDPYTPNGEMGRWFLVLGSTISLKDNKEAILASNRLSQEIVLENEQEQANNVLRSAKGYFDFLLNTIDEASQQDLPFPTSLKTQGVTKWDRKQWAKVTDEDDWNSVRAAILSKKDALMKKLKTELEQQQVDYAPVNAEHPSDIQLLMYALEQDKNADVLVTAETAKDIDTRIKSAVEGNELQKLQQKINATLPQQMEERWSEQTKPLDEDTCLGDGILNANTFNISDLLKL